jgi:ABC-type cobalamin/Fe3+-siderophores transport system ATPase subunit
MLRPGDDMARIVSFKVTGLAGREGVYEKTLERDTNVFYGPNGSGKTTLLKILYSALSVDAQILDSLAFESAEVDVHLNKHNRVFKRTFTKPSSDEPVAEPHSVSTPLYDALYGTRPSLIRRRRRPQWESVPPEPGEGKLTQYRLGFLPITRLYRAVGRSTTGERALSEDELDARFAEHVQQLWTEYYADMSSEISAAQEIGLANILHYVLSGEDSETQAETAVEIQDAYERVSSFLHRQPALTSVLGSKQEFEKKYKRDPQTKSIVKQIDAVEKRIEEVTAPRQRLQELLESMYSGTKKIAFAEKEITIQTSNKKNIGLPALSSGEKQLFFIALNSLQCGNSSLIVDEPELSMHVDWQKKLINSLFQLNPRMQFIAATHSPEIIADIPDSKVFSL